MIMTAPVQTLGPADPNAPVVQKVYTAIAAVLGIVTAASTFHLITTEQATALSNVGTSAVGLIGAGITALAAFRTKKQLSNGTFDAAPPPPVNPVKDAFAALAELRQGVDDTVSHATSQVIQASATIQGAVAMIPAAVSIGNATLTGPVGDFVNRIRENGGPSVAAPRTVDAGTA